MIFLESTAIRRGGGGGGQLLDMKKILGDISYKLSLSRGYKNPHALKCEWKAPHSYPGNAGHKWEISTF